MVKPKVSDEKTGTTLISEQEMLDREKTYLQRLQDVSVCCGFIRGKYNHWRYNQL